MDIFFPELTWIHETVRIYLLSIGSKFINHSLVQIFKFGNTDSMFPGNHTIQCNSLFHDLVSRTLGPVHHFPVIGQNRDIHMDISVAGVHVGGNDNQTGTCVFVYFFNIFQNQAIAPEAFIDLIEKIPGMDGSFQGIPGGNLKFFPNSIGKILCPSNFFGQPFRIGQRNSPVKVCHNILDDPGLVVFFFFKICFINEPDKI